ncbi:hypothetical protein A3F28_01170 [Candidatus Uhrbacteria bacterium RIFCSPHIGHO2_12_FULL_57_11]|uniref:Uncharacterized protein n=2 Tax=Candidatus Uhriibacteriota TaxID=1752732 RepID=A0A1F7UN62_9BACT|nr:MAG: hypothetical protein A3D72_00960 [Candidatus Uhrbacteria bacterium RIFCSPHIGHO2_02_FULL_57_19]OGL79148.1 MAG: hypothetical protein A3F28_01170 [Candidatus Uhrbacteria bacterium RIFCSPHIGHO2_12_FULL_57_11]
MRIRKSAVLVAILLVIAAAAAGFIWGLPAWRAEQDRSLRDRLAHDQKTADSYQMLLKGEERMKREPDNPEGFLTAGLAWKSIGDSTGERQFIERALAVYEKGVLLFGDRNAVVVLDAANLNRQLGDYARAEKLYRDAISVNPGGADAYLALVDLYRYDLKKDSKDIIDVYRQALATVVENPEIVQHLAFYLKDVGRYADALSYFELLDKQYPGQFTEVIDELRQKIASI